jgi:hypothetical protein
MEIRFDLEADEFGCEEWNAQDCGLNLNDTNQEVPRDKKSLSMGLLVPDAIQFICSEGSGLRWDTEASAYEVGTSATSPVPIELNE